MHVFWLLILGLFLLLTLVAWPIWPYSRDWTLKTSLVGIAGILILIVSFWVGLLSLWPLVG